MAKLALISTLLWLILFTLRIIQIGGLDPTFQDQETEVLLPLRDSLARQLDQTLPYPQSALLSGIILGAKHQLPASLKNKLKDTGTIHMVVVSGQNLSLTAGFLLGLAFLIGRRFSILLSLLAITFYSLLTGLGVPVVRAAIMAGLGFLGQMLGKDRVGWWGLMLTAGGMLLYQPNWLLSLSFLLSFTATFGVVVIAPVVADKVSRVPGIIRQDLAVSIAAYFMTLPLIVYNFNSLSLTAILVNSLILWTIPVIMVSGFITLALGAITPVLGQLASLVPATLLTYFIYVVEFFAGLPLASINLPPTVWWLWLGYYLLMGGVVWQIKTKNF